MSRETDEYFQSQELQELRSIVENLKRELKERDDEIDRLKEIIESFNEQARG